LQCSPSQIFLPIFSKEKKEEGKKTARYSSPLRETVGISAQSRKKGRKEKRKEEKL